ncbi:hypothetical protein LAUMK191_02759 [Mycobacterium attenuatum]|uniref:Uncharacterized protein n=1 Tax=Mycobacterium attenuatum TaxID=2341086 RepID=A0A498Q3H4_9MYCO|nr:hypothetical protein LAUMK136_02792 [Mycobacterium attenuatum]VBA53340.1 hypothetical protein LAUMK191_02759 [Mycobacterium attenuatum]VBA58199.1 hypothetical protein LAUMK41_02836 [Mycobacterium attenuatum]
MYFLETQPDSRRSAARGVTAVYTTRFAARSQQTRFSGAVDHLPPTATMTDAADAAAEVPVG